MAPSLMDLLLQICNKETANLVKPHPGSVLNLITKQLEGKDCNNLEIDLLDLFICLKIPLLHENKVVRTSGLRVIRLCLHDEKAVQTLIQANIHHFIAKCFDVVMDNMAERAQALRLCRKMLLIYPQSFPVALGRSIVALALDGGKEKDRLVRASLAILSELCILNAEVFVASGGIRCFASAVLDCSSLRMQEAMVASLLYLLNTEQLRGISQLNLRFLVAPYSDFHYKHYIDIGDANNLSVSNDDRELRLLCAKQALLTVLRSWPGLIHFISCNILEDLVKVLLPSHLDTRKAMLDFFYTLLRLPLPEWTDEFSVAILATDPSRVQDAWKLQDGYIALEGKTLLPHVSKFRPSLVLNHTALIVYCLVEAGLIQTLVEVIVTSDTFISVRATILLGELMHLTGTLLPPACHSKKTSLPKLIDYITWSKTDAVKSHRAAQAALALSKIHQLKKKEVTPHSLGLKQIVELERRRRSDNPVDSLICLKDQSDLKTNSDPDSERRSGRDPDGILLSLIRDCGVLNQKDPLLWNWNILSNFFLWIRMNVYVLEDSSIRSIVRRVMQFFKPSSNQFSQCEFSSQRTRSYSVVGSLLFDFFTAFEEVEYEKMLAEFLDDVSCVIRDITAAASAHDCFLSPGRLSTTASQDYFLFIGRLSSTTNGITALEKAGIFQDLLELVTATHHDCYLKIIASNLNYHSDGYARAILKKILLGAVESGRVYATQHLRVLVRAAVVGKCSASLAQWLIPLLVNQLKDKCRAVVMAAADILAEATDDPACIEALIALLPQFTQIIHDDSHQHLDSKGNLLLIKTCSTPSGFKLWQQTDSGGVSLIQQELDRWITSLNVRYVQMIESDVADGLTQHQRAEDGRYGRISHSRQTIRDLSLPPHLFSQLNQYREGLDFLRTSGHLSRIFALVKEGPILTEEDVLELKAAVWAAGHLGTSEAGVALLESASVVESFIHIASHSPVYALRGTAFYALNLVAMTTAGVEILSRLGWASIKRHHGELWHVIDEAEWYCFQPEVVANERKDVAATERARTMSLCSSHSVSFAGAANTSTPCRAAEIAGVAGTSSTCWETDSQPYSLEGSSIQFDSDSDYSIHDVDRSRRSYTLPPCSQAPMENVIHFRSLSESHYQPSEELTEGSSSGPQKEIRIWSKLRSSLRLPKSKRFSGFTFPRRLSKSPIPVVEVNDSALEDKFKPPEPDDDPSSDEYQLNRLGSVSSPSVPHKKRSFSTSSNWTSCYIGLSLPQRLSQFQPVVEQYKPDFDDSTDSAFHTVSEEAQFEHVTAQCLLCCRHFGSTFQLRNAGNLTDQSDVERLTVRKELLRLVYNLGSSVGLNANEQGLLRLKQRFTWAFQDICLFSDVCNVLATYGYRLRTRRFLHELFMDSAFDELYIEAESRLVNRQMDK